ncbi:Uncharacterised protein [Vibrio cholerae]|nr:Uncharacterised protein [Vibrio cholerae]CSD03223.1 Uncharacterised protein [Vibrio cholerae]CSI58450.1 Uncharacterised protein [Vibrio cholerae]
MVKILRFLVTIKHFFELMPALNQLVVILLNVTGYRPVEQSEHGG